VNGCFFAAQSQSEAEAILGFLYDDETGYGVSRRAEAETCLPSVFFRPAASCQLTGRWGGSLRLRSPLPPDDRCHPDETNVDGVLDIAGNIVALETPEATIMGNIDRLCSIDVASADGLDRWELQCDEQGRCVGMRHVSAVSGCELEWSVDAVLNPA